MKKIKIGYFADGGWSHKAFEKIINDSLIEICFIVPRNGTKDHTLKNYSEKYNIDYLFPVKLNDPSFKGVVEKYQCDLFVSMSYNQIFRPNIIEIPSMGTINCHAGCLPFYRGRNILNWALINDEKEFGITVHYVDEGIDTGDIILQKTYQISDADNYRTLLERSYDECAEILYESIKQIQNGTSKRIKQSSIHSTGFYCGRRGEGDEIVNWNQNSRELFNFIRSICKPGPMATTSKNKCVVKIDKATMVFGAPKYKGTCGQLLNKTKKGFIVKTKDSVIEIFDIESSIELRVGDKLI